MDQAVTEVTICMGSSCFSRGNRLVLQAIKEYLKEHMLDDKVVFKGAHCMGSCERGPVVMINDKPYYEVNQSSVQGILDAFFLTIK